MREFSARPGFTPSIPGVPAQVKKGGALALTLWIENLLLRDGHYWVMESEWTLILRKPAKIVSKICENPQLLYAIIRDIRLIRAYPRSISI